MKTCSLTEAKAKLGALADQALSGEPTLIPRGGQLVILQAYDLPAHLDEFDTLIDAGKASPKRTLSTKTLAQIWDRPRKKNGA